MLLLSSDEHGTNICVNCIISVEINNPVLKVSFFLSKVVNFVARNVSILFCCSSPNETLPQKFVYTVSKICVKTPQLCVKSPHQCAKSPQLCVKSGAGDVCAVLQLSTRDRGDGAAAQRRRGAVARPAQRSQQSVLEQQ